MDGFDNLGAEDSKTFDTMAFLKTAGPAVASAVEEGMKKDKKTETPTTPQGSGESWLTKPVLGPVPGGGVLALAAAAVGGLFFFLRRR